MNVTSPPVSATHKAARWYASRNIFVFPLHSIVDDEGHCSCRKPDCTNQGKHPRTMNGFKDATTDLETVDRWWGMWPNANVGIDCERSGWAVLDVDPDKGGYDSLAELQQKHGDLPDTVRAITGGAGAHIVFKMPRQGFRSYVGIGYGLDTRGIGGYIVAAPSNHKSGGNYVWEEGFTFADVDIAEVPQWMLDIMAQRGAERPQVAADGDIIPEGQRDATLASLAGSMRARGMTEAEILAALQVTNETRVRPPMALADLERIARSIGRYEPGKGTYTTNMGKPSQHVTVDAETGEITPSLQGRVLIDPVLRDGLPEPEWVIDQLVVAGRIHLVYGEPESGKTIIALSWVVQCIERGVPVVFVDEESGLQAIARLLIAMGVDSVDPLLHYFPFVSLSLEDTEALMAYVDEVRPGLVVFDSLTDMLAGAGLDENAGIEVTRWFMEVPTRITRSDWEPAVVLIDHIAKDAGNTNYSVASRAKKAKSDVQWLVTKTADFGPDKTAPVDLTRKKNRPGVMPDRVRLTVGGQDGKLICRPFDSQQDVMHTLPDKALEMLDFIIREGEATPSEIEAKLGFGPKTIQRFGARLCASGKVERVGSGQVWKYVSLVDSPPNLVDMSTSIGEGIGGHPIPPLGGDVHLSTNGPTTENDEEGDEPWWT